MSRSPDILDQLEQLPPAELIALAATHGIALPSPSDFAQLAKAEALRHPPVVTSSRARHAIALYETVAAM